MIVERAVCPACYQPFAAGEHVTLAPLGPGDDPGLREHAATGRWYSGSGVICHYACRFGREPNEPPHVPNERCTAEDACEGPESGRRPDA